MPKLSEDQEHLVLRMEAVREAAASRDQLIREGHSMDVPIAVMGRALGVTRPTVRAALRREGDTHG